jgi:hypothetical protein
LVIPDHVAGLPVLRALSFVYVLPPLPRCSGWASSSLISPNRISLRRTRYRLGLHITLFEDCSAYHSRCGPHTRAVTSVTAIQRLQTFRYLHACSGCFRLERFAGWDLHPLESAAFHGARGERGLAERQEGSG